MATETTRPGGEEDWRHGFKVDSAEEEDGCAPGDYEQGIEEEGEHKIVGTKVELQDMGAKVEAHSQGSTRRGEAG